jgi:hypothetical protein
MIPTAIVAALIISGWGALGLATRNPWLVFIPFALLTLDFLVYGRLSALYVLAHALQ